jgi:integrase
MKLTVKDAAGLKLPAEKSDWIAFDDDAPGLGLRLRAGGSRMWIFQYALGDKQRRMTLGSTKSMTLGKAREAAGTLHAKVRLGQDPANEKTEGRLRAAETFEAVGQRFLAYQKGELRPGSYVEIERHMLKHAKPLHGIQLAIIDRRSIAGRISAIGAQSGAVTANRVRSTLSAFFGWVMREGIAEQNPVIGTNKFEEVTRERVLADDELRAIWRALQDDHYGSIVKLLMLTGQRANEIANLAWSEIGDDAITLPPARTKNHRQHRVPLSDAALAILAAQPRRLDAAGSPRDLVFGMGERGFSGWSKCKERLDERITKAAGRPLPHWTLHDLRRTCATRMADLGILPHVIEAVLNHVSGHKSGVAGIYNRALYEPEKRQALALWTDRVLALVDGRSSNVTVLKRA